MNLLEFAQLLGNEDVREVLDFVGLDVLSTLEVKKSEVKKEDKKKKEKPVVKQKRLPIRKQASPRMTITLTPENDEYVKRGAYMLNMSWALYVNMILDKDRENIDKSSVFHVLRPGVYFERSDV